MKTLIIFSLFLVFQLGFTDPPNPRREAIRFMTSLHKHYSMRDPDILHEDFHEVKKDGTLVSREKAVNFIKNLSAKQVETRANSSKVWSRSTIEDRDPAWKNHIAKLTEDDLIEIKQYNNNTLYIRVLGKPDPKMEGGYKFYRMFRYY